MKRIGGSFVDERLRWPEGQCVHCGGSLDPSTATREHVPSKCLLREPYPRELITMEACRECNAGFSKDEQYLFAVLEAVQVGSTDPAKQRSPKASRVFRRHPGLRKRVEQSRREVQTPYDSTEVSFVPEMGRVNRVVIKHARCHALYELDQALSRDPDYVNAVPLERLSPRQRDNFDSIEGAKSGWAEVGTRMFQRQCYWTGPVRSDLWGAWVIVQEGVYRYALADLDAGFLVRSVIHDYLATEAYWEFDDLTD